MGRIGRVATMGRWNFDWLYVAILALGIVGCSDSKQALPRQPEQAQPSKPVTPSDVKTISRGMHEFFEQTMRARDAIINGDVASAKKALEMLAAQELGTTTLSLEWSTQLERWRAVARLGGHSKSLEEAAASVSKLGAQCGQCHQALRKGPEFDPSGWVEDTDDLQAHMFLLTWASDRMWEGLTEPWDRAWRVGAETLVEAPIKLSALKKKLGPKLSNAPDYARDLQRIGEMALSQKDAEARAEAFGQVLLTCASCHSAVRDKAQPK